MAKAKTRPPVGVRFTVSQQPIVDEAIRLSGKSAYKAAQEATFRWATGFVKRHTKKRPAAAVESSETLPSREVA